MVGIFSSDQLRGILSADLYERTKAVDDALVSDVNAIFSEHDAVTAAQRADLISYLPDDLLVKVDIASMANSLEVRSPLLDRELVEFCARLPPALKIRSGRRKYLLRRAMEGIVPRENLDREKQGFGVPLDRWIRAELRDAVEEAITSPASPLRRYVDLGATTRMLRDHLDGRASHGHRLWTLLMLDLWHRIVLAAPSSARAR